MTGSGKTEVYLRAVGEVLARGGSVLVLCPEIGLTPQLLERFERRFAASIAALHSGLTDTERARAWHLAASGQARIVIGTRSAVFTPIPGLRLIIVDEEHDSFLQAAGRRLPLFRARPGAAARPAARKCRWCWARPRLRSRSLHNVTLGG